MNITIRRDLARLVSPAETRDFVQSSLDMGSDYILQITIAAGRSKIFRNSLAAMHALTAAHNRARRGMAIASRSEPQWSTQRPALLVRA